MANRLHQWRNMTSLLFVNAVFGPILHILIIHCQGDVCSSFVAIDIFLKIVSTHRQRHVASETGFKQDLPNPNPYSDSLIEYSFYTEFNFGFTVYPNSDSLIEYPLIYSPIQTHETLPPSVTLSRNCK